MLYKGHVRLLGTPDEFQALRPTASSTSSFAARRTGRWSLSRQRY